MYPCIEACPSLPPFGAANAFWYSWLLDLRELFLVSLCSCCLCLGEPLRSQEISGFGSRLGLVDDRV